MYLQRRDLKRQTVEDSHEDCGLSLPSTYVGSALGRALIIASMDERNHHNK